MDKQPEEPIMVSICCIVYNHAPYLHQCFDGFVMQKTTFPIEILVHDDASTDGSADIIREYTAKYPHLFKPVYQTENQYSKNVPICATFQYPRAKGKYIAMCEGDDYWTDPYKLQKQVDFMEKYLQYVLCFHDATIIDSNGVVLNNSKIARNMGLDKCRDWTSFELMCGWTPPTPSVLFRKNDIDRVLSLIPNNIICGDTVLASLLGQFGSGKYLSEIRNSVCRVHNGGVWQMKSDIYKITNAYITNCILQKLHKKNLNVVQYFNEHKFKLAYSGVLLAIKSRNLKSYIKFDSIITWNLIKTIKIKQLINFQRDKVYIYRKSLN